MDLTQEVEKLNKRVQELEKRNRDLGEILEGLTARMDPNPALQLRTNTDFSEFWVLTRGLAEKDEWDIENDIRPYYSYAWYLMAPELRRLEKVSKNQYCWQVVLNLLQRMRYYIETHPLFKRTLELKFVSECVAAAEARLNAAIINYLIEYEPEVYDLVRDYMENRLDLVTVPRA